MLAIKKKYIFLIYNKENPNVLVYLFIMYQAETNSLPSLPLVPSVHKSKYEYGKLPMSNKYYPSYDWDGWIEKWVRYKVLNIKHLL